jgi:uncharacterized protein
MHERLTPDLDAAAILELNRQNEKFTAPIEMPALQSLLAQAFHLGLRAGGREAFLIGLDETASYDSPNFQWFKTRFPRFAYVDRIVVASSARGHGIARALYEELFAVAAAAGHTLVAAEVNVDPPNPVSDRFHDALGFHEVGRGQILGGAKTVRYLIRPLTSV